MNTRFLSALALMICLAFATLSLGQSTTKDTVIIIKVSGIICGMDLPIISDTLKKQDGVKDCKAIGKAAAVTRFEITYDPNKISYQQIVNIVQNAPSCEDPKEKPYKVKKNK